MSSKVDSLFVQPNKTVEWLCDGTLISKPFKGDVCAYYVEPLNEVLVLADSEFDGPRNVFIYRADGTLRLNPQMPKLKSNVSGVYAIWFIAGKLQHEAVLLTNEFLPYDTGCTFDLEDGIFSNFHPTK